MLILFYFTYLSTVIVGSLIFLEKSLPRGLDENYFGLIALIEFASLLHFRT